MRNSNYILLLISLIFSVGTQALHITEPRALLRIKCTELLDMTSYAVYFSHELEIIGQNSKEFTLESFIYPEDVQTKMTYKILSHDEFPMIEIIWSDYFRGQLLELRSNRYVIERNIRYEVELTARHYAPLFRNSCSFELQ